MKSEAIDRFVVNIERLIKGEIFDMYKAMISASFEYIAAEILSEQLEKGIWYDGISGLKAEVIATNQVRFTGDMYVFFEQEKSWKEPFESVVKIDTKTKKEVMVYVKIGSHEGKNNLLTMDWQYRNT
ncbi:hypothetical protein [Pseudoalteromonas luteoviolacea]|uniref:DUF4440 domain-containing protein n=1 Tax=Pseudoalteromonas luteoviolacea DSM 6061 TaxID=1365250 RepID=A0A166Y7S0_9GAMM|nr:hypothetical protein [Pseudoalteromonas luteoviolacea]KZN41531.1 hypothetical protein N475_10695 [Pseudoalteromonas luteoviolacea DSM 6061]MBE0385507.1 hypothetical protein [Pseudoalteromonas luteoviolacea DSM 6061]